MNFQCLEFTGSNVVTSILSLVVDVILYKRELFAGPVVEGNFRGGSNG